MKNLFISTLFVMSAIAAITISPVIASADECRFPYDLSEDGGVKHLRSFPIKLDTQLTRLQKQQVVITANRLMADSGYDDIVYDNARFAIEALHEASEAGDITYFVFKLEGEIYSSVQIYPGGNPYGVIFQGTQAVGERHDGDVVCL